MDKLGYYKVTRYCCMICDAEHKTIESALECHEDFFVKNAVSEKEKKQ